MKDYEIRKCEKCNIKYMFVTFYKRDEFDYQERYCSHKCAYLAGFMLEDAKA